VRTLIVDDEPLARERLRSLMEAEADFEIVGECGDGQSVVEFAGKQPVDLILLDIQMPVMDGFAVVRQLKAATAQAIVFVTAFDQYALQAFEVHALDYLLKPVEAERLKSTLSRVRTSHQRQARHDQLQLRLDSLVSEIEASRAGTGRILFKNSGAYSFLETKDIDWIESAGNYVDLHAEGKNVLLRETMSGTEEKLRTHGFVRISRSVIVNSNKIRTLSPLQFGEYSVELTNGTRLVLTRGYRADFFRSVEKLG
jgi:two-component system LytT family response regulator